MRVGGLEQLAALEAMHEDLLHHVTKGLVPQRDLLSVVSLQLSQAAAQPVRRRHRLRAAAVRGRADLVRVWGLGLGLGLGSGSGFGLGLGLGLGLARLQCVGGPSGAPTSLSFSLVARERGEPMPG